MHKFQVGQKVSARMCNLHLGNGEIVDLAEDDDRKTPMYRVLCQDCTYYLYEDELYLVDS